eukprot:g38451.t1
MYGTPARVLNLDHPVFTGRASLPYAKFPAYVGGSKHQYLRVVQLLLRAGMISLLPPSHVFAVNGVFTVPRSDGILRFIMDARNTNELFLPPMDPNLPGPDCIAQLDLRPSDEVWAATSDISNFYDCFLLPEWMLPFMALPSVFIAGIGLVHPCMRWQYTLLKELSLRGIHLSTKCRMTHPWAPQQSHTYSPQYQPHQHYQPQYQQHVQYHAQPAYSHQQQPHYDQAYQNGSHQQLQWQHPASQQGFQNTPWLAARAPAVHAWPSQGSYTGSEQQLPPYQQSVPTAYQPPPYQQPAPTSYQLPPTSQPPPPGASPWAAQTAHYQPALPVVPPAQPPSLPPSSDPSQPASSAGQTVIISRRKSRNRSPSSESSFHSSRSRSPSRRRRRRRSRRSRSRSSSRSRSRSAGRKKRFQEARDEPPPLPPPLPGEGAEQHEEADKSAQPNPVQVREAGSGYREKRHLGAYIPDKAFAEFMAKAEGKDVDKNRLQADNKGHKLLKAMGWKEGEGLGKEGTGIVAPVQAQLKADNGGVGTSDPSEVRADDDDFTKYKKRMMLAYKYRAGNIHPLVPTLASTAVEQIVILFSLLFASWSLASTFKRLSNFLIVMVAFCFS